MTPMNRYQCVLVTGASACLGEEYAWQLAPRASSLVLVARREDRLRALAGAIHERFPDVGISVFAVDLADEAERERLVESLAMEGVVPDLLVNNAGLGDYGEFATAEWGKLQAMLRVNIEALTHLTRMLVPGMIGRGRGAVMNVSSLASLLPIPDFAVYAATKAYVTRFSEALRIELKEHGIPVLAVCPGPVHTEFGDVARRSKDSPGLPGRESFYIPKYRVVSESLQALDKKCARVFPGMRTAAAAMVISVLPLVVLRFALARMRQPKC